VAVEPAGEHAVFGCWDGTLARWDLRNCRELHCVNAPIGSVQLMEMAPDGKRIIWAATRAGILGVWDFQSEGFYFKAHDELISALAVMPDGDHAITCTWGNQVKLWNLANRQELRAVHLNTRMICSLAVTSDGKRAVLSDLHALRVFDIENWTEIASLQSRLGRPQCVAITPDGKQALAGLAEGRIVAWDLGSGTESLVLKGHSDSVVSLAVTADGTRLVSASSDQTVKLWDRKTGDLIAAFACDGAIVDLAITQDARMIVAVDALGRGHFLAVEE
jgi:WD40 repeat protein